MNISHRDLPDRIARWLQDLQRDYGDRVYNSRQKLQVSFISAEGAEIVGTFSMSYEKIADQKLQANPSLQQRVVGVKQQDRINAAKRRGDI